MPKWPSCPHLTQVSTCFLHHFLKWPNFWHLEHLVGCGMYWSTISWCQSVSFIRGGSWHLSNVRTYRFVSTSSPFTLVFMRSIFVTPWGFNFSISLSWEHFDIVPLTTVPFTVFSVLCVSAVTLFSASFLISFSFLPWASLLTSTRRELLFSLVIFWVFPILSVNSASMVITSVPVPKSTPGKFRT